MKKSFITSDPVHRLTVVADGRILNAVIDHSETDILTSVMI